MKKRTLALLLCLMMAFSVISPATALAAGPELDTPVVDPIEPDPYTYISQIGIDFRMDTNGDSSDYCSAYVPGGYYYTLTMRLQKKVNGYWDTANPVATWTNSGTNTVYIDDGYSGLPYGTYRLSVTVSVYDGGLLGESVTEHSRTAVYNSSGVVYYW